MISYEEFKEIVVKTLERDISSNQDQNSAISSRADQSLFIVAGPGYKKSGQGTDVTYFKLGKRN